MTDASKLNPITGSTPLHLKSICRRFTALNDGRLARMREVLRAEQRGFLDTLALLFHINDPLLPGFVSKKTPAGIANFNPSSQAVDAASKLARKFSYRRRALRTYSIRAIYMIGSSGTVAYSDKSDFDVWVCHDPQLNETQLGLLREKCAGVRLWAASLGLEVTFFLMDPASFRRGETDALSEDSSGSAQHRLLLEEFYRTGLLLAGRYPAWWLVPPDAEAEYDAHLSNLVNKGYVHEHEFVDFGSVTHIPASEFFGATLWQLHKALDSPYKSVLKLLLIEAYTTEYPHTDLLCARFKRAVYNGETNIDNLDPYVLMVEKVEEYLARRGEQERINLAQRCFYFKVGERLSDRSSRHPNPRRDKMHELTQRWNWGHDQLLVLDSRSTWKIHRVLDERRALVDELTRSYKIVSEFAHKHARNASINSADLNLLGRRLYTAFERKAGKVEIINPGISTDLTEEHLEFSYVEEHGVQGWALFRGDHSGARARTSAALKRAASLIELAAWCHFNRIIGSQTLITLDAGSASLTSRELLSVIDSLRRLFPNGGLPQIEMEQLRKPARVVASALFINLGVDPLSEHTRNGMQLTSNRADALSYGGFWKNLALSFDLLLVTSWHEVLTFHYSGDHAQLECLCDYLAWAPLSQAIAPLTVPVYSFSTARGMAIAHRVEELFRDVSQAFYERAGGSHCRYVLLVEHDYYILESENDVPRYRRVGNASALPAALGGAQNTFSPVVFDRYAMDESPLARIVEHNRRDVVQLFYFVDAGRADIYIVDERGSLFRQTAVYHSEEALLGQYQRFLESIIGRCNVGERSPDAVQISLEVEFYRMRKDRTGQISLERRRTKQFTETESGRYMSIQVIGLPQPDERTMFSLYCEGKEFSSLEYGDGVFTQVARYVLGRRHNNIRYPIYITDVDVNRTVLGADASTTLQTIHYLEYKKAIEQKLNSALHQL